MSPWVRIDENAMEHHKIGNLSDGGFRLWVQGLAHCQKFLTDGYIAEGAVRLLRAYSPKRRGELLTSGLWELSETGISVHDFLDWNESREHVMAARKAARNRMSKLRGSSRELQPNSERSSLSVRDPRNVHHVTEQNKGESAAPKPRAVQGPGAGAGTYPRDHLRCVHPCGRVCLPDQLFSDFVKLRGGNVREAEEYVRSWKGAVDAAWAVGSGLCGDVAIGDDRFGFWRARWRDDHGTTKRDYDMPRDLVPRDPIPHESFGIAEWLSECQQLHGGACNMSKSRHDERMAREVKAG